MVTPIIPATPYMYLVVIAWLYVVVMMTLAEATSPAGTLVGAVLTFFMYGVGPIALVMYLMATPARRRARKAAERQETEARSGLQEETDGS